MAAFQGVPSKYIQFVQEYGMSPKETKPAQKQSQPGKQKEMRPKPQTQPRFAGSGKFKDKVAIITGGDSGIGRAVAIAFANEGADICVVYLEEDNDAQETKSWSRKRAAAASW